MSKLDNMKIRIITIILVVILSLLLGCSKKGTNGSSEDTSGQTIGARTQSDTNQINTEDINDPRLQRALERVKEAENPVRRSRVVQPD